LQTKQQYTHLFFEKKKRLSQINPKIRQALITNESENPAGLFIFHLAFRGRDADEVALENSNTVSAS